MEDNERTLFKHTPDAFSILAIIALCALKRSQATTGSIIGTLKDQTGAVLANAKSNETATGVVRETNQRGRELCSPRLPGKYNLHSRRQVLGQ
jgi:hypothetical protein